MVDVVRFGTWYHIHNHYCPDNAPGGLFLDVSGESPPNYMDVSASVRKDRIGLGTGVWRLMPAMAGSGRQVGDDVKPGDTCFLQNYFGAMGYLDVRGECRACHGTNTFDVSTSVVKAPGGTGSTSTVWKVLANDVDADPSRAFNEGDPVHLMSVQQNQYLDSCGAGNNGNRNDVSLSTSKDRDHYSGTWSFLPYDDTAFLAEVEKEDCVPANTIRIEGIQCVIPSSGIAAASVFGGAAAILGGAAGAVVGTAITAPAVVGSGGVFTPAALALIGFVAVESAAYSAAVAVGVQKLSTVIGTTMNDQTYLVSAGNKIWPSDSRYKIMNAGDRYDVGYDIRRDLDKTYSVEIWEHDHILSDDLLARIDIAPGAECVHAQIPYINDVEGSAYILQVTATSTRTSHEILLAQHAQEMSRLHTP